MTVGASARLPQRCRTNALGQSSPGRVLAFPVHKRPQMAQLTPAET
jgi:hypothetical protein